MIAAVKVRGDIDARQKVSRTLQDLNLEKKNQAVVFEESDSIKGMLKIVKDYITFGEISEETIEKLEERADEEIENGSVIDLPPPSGGYKNTKKNVAEGGSLGENPDIDNLIQRMV